MSGRKTNSANCILKSTICTLTYNMLLCIIAYNYIRGQSKAAGKWQMPTEGVILSGIFGSERFVYQDTCRYEFAKMGL